MRALYIKDLANESSYIITGESLHHLVNVARIDKGEKLLLLDGKGLNITTLVEDVSRREMKLSNLDKTNFNRTYSIDLALGVPKKDALELSLKEATELGISKVYLVRSEYSQMRLPESERIENLLISALEQSNAPYMPEISCDEWNSIPWERYKEVWLLNSQEKSNSQAQAAVEKTQHLIIIGPEGGFSEKELLYFKGIKNLRMIHLPTPILRTPTAVAAATGMMLEYLRNRNSHC